MGKRTWTDKKLELLRSNYPENGSSFCAEKLKRSVKAIRSKAKVLKIKVNNRHILTRSEIEYIIKHYPHRRTRDIERELGVSKNSIYKYVARIGLKKTAEFLASPESGIMRKGTTRGLKTQFKKGHTPANKGKKMSPELRKRVEHTFFKKGHVPVNTLCDGAITTRNDKRGIPQKHIRISPRKWQYLSNYIWEQANGPKPKGYNIVFKDRNALNYDLKNLELISDSELMLRNSIMNYPEELRSTIRTLSTLNKEINKHEKQD